MTFTEAKQDATKTKSVKKKHHAKLEPIKETLVRTTGLEYDDIATKDSDIDEKLLSM